MRALLGMGVLLGMLAVGQPARAASVSERELEGLLLHRALPLEQVERYSRTHRTWQPLRSSGARVRVVNLWALTCKPCLAEMPELRTIAAAWSQRSPKDVEFLFIADPPELTPVSALTAFWASPFVDGLGDKCPGVRMQRQGVDSCLVEVPDVDPARSKNNELLRALAKVESRPLTLLLDEQGIVRQVFAGSLLSKRAQVLDAIERLLQVTKPDAATASRRTASR